MSKYSKKLIIKVCEEYLSGDLSERELCAKYGILSKEALRRWFLQYRALKDYCPKREIYMAEARRKTTIDERKEIVQYCLIHGRNYKDTVALYDVSYSRVYSWVKKYDTNEESALLDKRGHHKTDDEVDELERQLEEKDILTELLKKVQEFERM